MTAINRELGVTFLVGAATITVSALLVFWGTAPALTLAGSAIGIGYLVWPVMFAAAVAFLLHLWIWASRPPRSKALPGLPKQLSPEATTYLLKVRALFRDTAWSLLLVGVLVSWAGTRDAAAVYCNFIALAGISLGFWAGRPTAIVPLPLWVALLLGGLSGLIANLAEPQLYYGLLGGAGLVLTAMVFVDLLSLRFPWAGSIFGFPRYRLLALALVAMLSYQSWSAGYGFLESPLMPGLTMAVGVNYLADVVRQASDMGSSRWRQVSSAFNSAGNLCLAASCGLLVWALTSALPNVSALLLGQWPNHQFGPASLPHFSHVFEARKFDRRVLDSDGLCLAAAQNEERQHHGAVRIGAQGRLLWSGRRIGLAVDGATGPSGSWIPSDRSYGRLRPVRGGSGVAGRDLHIQSDRHRESGDGLVLTIHLPSVLVGGSLGLVRTSDTTYTLRPAVVRPLIRVDSGAGLRRFRVLPHETHDTVGVARGKLNAAAVGQLVSPCSRYPGSTMIQGWMPYWVRFSIF